MPSATHVHGSQRSGTSSATAHTVAKRQLWLPAAALAFLIVGGVTLLAGSRLDGLAHRIWFVGLVLTSAPVLWTTLRQAMRGHLAMVAASLGFLHRTASC
jgi:hypothetical protein